MKKMLTILMILVMAVSSMAVLSGCKKEEAEPTLSLEQKIFREIESWETEEGETYVILYHKDTMQMFVSEKVDGDYIQPEPLFDEDGFYEYYDPESTL